MKRIISLSLLTLFVAGIMAQPGDEKEKSGKGKNKKESKPKISVEDKRHRDKVDKSRKSGKATSSRDTLYNAGKPYCIAKETSHNLIGGVTGYSIHSFKTSNEEIKISLESVTSGSKTYYYWVWLQGKDRFETEQKESPLDIICYFYVYKDSVFNQKNFTSLRQNKAKIISGYTGTPSDNPKKDEGTNRNRTDEITFSGRDIRQSSVLIGHIENATNTVKGAIITTYTIYDPQGHIVATAKNHGITDHEWDITTASDNRNHQVSSSLLNDQKDVVSFLVKMLYL